MRLLVGRFAVSFPAGSAAANSQRLPLLGVFQAVLNALAQVTVAAIGGVAAGWSLVDNFDRYTEGLLNGQGGWKDLDAVEWTVANVNGNLMAVATNNNATAVLRLGTLSIPPGQQRTLFFRVYHANDEFAAAQGMVALTDRNVRFGSDVGAAGNDIGPGAIVSNEPGWGLMLGGANGNGASVEFYEPILQFQTVYNVWVDIKNDPLTPDPFSSGDIYSIHVAKDGEAQRTTVIRDYLSARGPGAADVGFATDTLDKLILGALAGHTADARLLFFDDLYLSKSGYLSTVPRPFGFTTPLPGQPPSLSISRSGNQVTVSWSAGTLESAPAVTGPWTPVSGATSPYTTPAAEAARFYRARQ